MRKLIRHGAELHIIQLLNKHRKQYNPNANFESKMGKGFKELELTTILPQLREIGYNFNIDYLATLIMESHFLVKTHHNRKDTVQFFGVNAIKDFLSEYEKELQLDPDMTPTMFQNNLFNYAHKVIISTLKESITGHSVSLTCEYDNLVKEFNAYKLLSLNFSQDYLGDIKLPESYTDYLLLSLKPIEVQVEEYIDPLMALMNVTQEDLASIDLELSGYEVFVPRVDEPLSEDERAFLIKEGISPEEVEEACGIKKTTKEIFK